MGLPKRIKKDIDVYPDSELLQRRQELLDRIVEQDTVLPESILHEDLDFGMLEFVKENLLFTTDSGNRVSFIERILTIQRWAEMSNTWPFTDEDGNIELPFVVVVRKPEVPYGSNPSLLYTIPDRHSFFYRRVPTWNGNRLGADIYKIPQPIPVDMSFDVVVVCNRMRELNKFNKKVMQKFSSRQAYTTVKGHYVPLVLEGISDQSQIDTLEGRRFYQQTYSFQLQGFLIDEDEFEVTPAVDRTMVVMESMDSIGSTRKISKVIKNNVEVYTERFIADGLTTTFKTSKKINNLLYVDLNGLVQQPGVDYYHNGNSSNIIFTSAPPQGSIINVSYTFDSNFEAPDGSPLKLYRETFTLGPNSGMVFNTTFAISDIIMVEVGGLVQLENDYYTFSKGNTYFEVNEVTPVDTPISIVYVTNI